MAAQAGVLGRLVCLLTPAACTVSSTSPESLARLAPALQSLARIGARMYNSRAGNDASEKPSSEAPGVSTARLAPGLVWPPQPAPHSTLGPAVDYEKPIRKPTYKPKYASVCTQDDVSESPDAVAEEVRRLFGANSGPSVNTVRKADTRGRNPGVPMGARHMCIGERVALDGAARVTVPRAPAVEAPAGPSGPIGVLGTNVVLPEDYGKVAQHKTGGTPSSAQAPGGPFTSPYMYVPRDQ